MNLQRRLMLCKASLMLSVPITRAFAAEWPTRPISLVVPFAPGGSTDTTARQLAQGMQDSLGQPIVIENRTGAGGNIGAGMVAQSKPDGHTLLMATNAHTASPSLYPSLTYRIERDLVPVAMVTTFPNVLVVRQGYAQGTVQLFIESVRDGKQALSYGSAGNGSSQHLTSSLLNSRVKGKLMHVPYSGGAPANVALLGGQVEFVIAPLVEVLPFIQSGKVKALAVTTLERSPVLPDVPALSEVLPGFEVNLWSAVMARSGTPKEVLATINKSIRHALKQPALREKLTQQGYSLFDEPLEALGGIFDKEIKRWTAMVRISGARID